MLLFLPILSKLWRRDGAMAEIDRRLLLKLIGASLVGSALPLSIANALPVPGKFASPGCCEEFPFFGAHYPDARCIDGYLWDLDSYEDGFLTSGGEYACPYCNATVFLNQLKDEVEEHGFIAFCEGYVPSDNPYYRSCRFPHLISPLQEFWRNGFREASITPFAIEDRRVAVA